MKPVLLFIYFLLFSLVVPAQLSIKEINKSLAKVSETLYASKYEVSNKLYATFLQSLKENKKSDLMNIAGVDSAKWADGMAYNQPYVEFYHTHPAYNDYPVVNVSYEGAVLFCEWLTVAYNADPRRKFNKVIFRLPTEEEWMTAARAGDSTAYYSLATPDVRDNNGTPQLNFVRDRDDYMGVASKYNDGADIMTPVKCYPPNKFGIYNMSGNASEMVNTMGFVKGGSWKDPIEELRIDNRIDDDGKPKATVGFRYFAVVIEK